MAMIPHLLGIDPVERQTWCRCGGLHTVMFFGWVELDELPLTGFEGMPVSVQRVVACEDCGEVRR
jgi:hypothetical protein